MTTVNQAGLETIYERIARIISRRYDCQLRIYGSRAFVNLETREIVLPSVGLTDDIWGRVLKNLGESKGMSLVLDGLHDHEVGHVRYSSLVGKEGKDSTIHHIHNIIEDPMVERLMGSDFPGCAQNLKALNTKLYEILDEKWPTMDAMGKLGYALERAIVGKPHPEGVTDSVVGPLLSALAPEIEDAKRCTTSEETLEVAKRVYDKIKKLAKGKSPPQSSKSAGSQQKQKKGDEGQSQLSPGSSHKDSDADQTSSKSQKSKPETSKRGSPEKKEEGDKKEEQSGESGSAEEDKDDESQSGESPSDSEGEDESPSVGEDGASDSSGAPESSPTEVQDAAKEFLRQEKNGFDQPLDREGLVNQQLDDILKDRTKGEPEHYVVFCTEYDRERIFSEVEKKSLEKDYKKAKDRVAKYVGPMAARLEMALAEEAASRWVGGAPRGRKWDRRRLVRWMEECTDNTNIYKYLEEGDSFDTAVSMLWDCSGSMGSAQRSLEGKASLARVAAVAFDDALERVKIPHEVLGFNTGGGRSSELSRLSEEAIRQGDSLERYSRVDELNNHMVFKAFGEKDGRAIAAINGHHCNRDGEAVLWAAKRLAARNEVRKILIVGSDGMPSGARYARLEETYLKDVIATVMKAGIEVYGLGIQSEHVKHYYPQWVVARTPEDLPRAVLTQLTRALLARSGTKNGIGRVLGAGV